MDIEVKTEQKIRHEKPGRPNLEESENVKTRLLNLIVELKISHPDQIKNVYNERYRKDARSKVTWRTIRKYLDDLLKECKIKQQIITKGDHRTISFIIPNTIDS